MNWKGEGDRQELCVAAEPCALPLVILFIPRLLRAGEACANAGGQDGKYTAGSCVNCVLCGPFMCAGNYIAFEK